MLKGRVISFDEKCGEGTILGDDGAEYAFNLVALKQPEIFEGLSPALRKGAIAIFQKNNKIKNALVAQSVDISCDSEKLLEYAKEKFILGVKDVDSLIHAELRSATGRDGVVIVLSQTTFSEELEDLMPSTLLQAASIVIGDTGEKNSFGALTFEYDGTHQPLDVVLEDNEKRLYLDISATVTFYPHDLEEIKYALKAGQAVAADMGRLKEKIIRKALLLGPASKRAA